MYHKEHLNLLQSSNSRTIYFEQSLPHEIMGNITGSSQNHIKLTMYEYKTSKTLIICTSRRTI